MPVLEIVFYIFSIITVSSAVFLAVSKNIVHSAFAFLIVLLGVAALFVLSEAEFVAVTQLLIYIGGVLVLLVFGVMLTASYTISNDKPSGVFLVSSLMVCVIFFCIFMFIVTKIDFKQLMSLQDNQSVVLQPDNSVPQRIGYLLMTDYLLPFEASGILLMVALIGAAMIAGKKPKMV